MFEFKNLDETTRNRMLSEANLHGVQVTVYFGKRLTSVGHADWPELLREAIQTGNP